VNRPVLIYDGDCAFCTSSARWIRSVVGAEHIEIQPYQGLDDLGGWGLTEQRASRAVWLGMPDGTLFGGAEAVNAALALRWWGRPLLWCYRLPLIRSIQDAVYRWVARNRARIPGGTPACGEGTEDPAKDDG